MSTWGQMNLIDPASPIQSEMILFHDHAMILLVGIFVFVGLLLFKFSFNSFNSRVLLDAQTLEIIWTIVPALLLIWLALPSMRLLYMLDESTNEGIVFKATGYQWYWTYESPNSYGSPIFSYMVPESNLNMGDYRLLEVSYSPKLPFLTNINTLTTSGDVIHSWTLPALGVKVDSIPGRMNSIGMYAYGPGVYYGQCSEICGAAHSFMPIRVEFTSIYLICI